MSTTSSNPFNPAAGSYISHADAHELVKNYEDQNASKKETVVRGIFFGKDKIDQLINHTEGSVGIRIYYGLEPNPGIGQPFTKKMVIVAVDSEGYDIPGSPNVPPDPNKPVSKTIPVDGYLDDGLPCPQHCPGGTKTTS